MNLCTLDRDVMEFLILLLRDCAIKTGQQAFRFGTISWVGGIRLESELVLFDLFADALPIIHINIQIRSGFGWANHAVDLREPNSVEQICDIMRALPQK